jgi:hypothetical protein
MDNLTAEQRALEQAARELAKYRENRDKPPHQRWSNPHARVNETDNQKGRQLIQQMQDGEFNDLDRKTGLDHKGHEHSHKETDTSIAPLPSLLQDSRPDTSMIKGVEDFGTYGSKF